MVLKQMYFPEIRVLENYETNQQIVFDSFSGYKEVYQLLEPRICKALVKVREEGAEYKEDIPRWLSLYKITLGDNEFEAGIICNYASDNDNHASYRVITDYEGIIDFKILNK